MRISGWNSRVAREAAILAEVIAVPDEAFDGAALLVSVPHDGSMDAVKDGLIKCGASVRSSVLVGSHATRYRVGAVGPVLAGNSPVPGV